MLDRFVGQHDPLVMTQGRPRMHQLTASTKLDATVKGFAIDGDPLQPVHRRPGCLSKVVGEGGGERLAIELGEQALDGRLTRSATRREPHMGQQISLLPRPHSAMASTEVWLARMALTTRVSSAPKG